MNKRKEELLIACIDYIWEHISNYEDMLDAFRHIGFTEEELIEYSLRDLDLESELGDNE